MFCGQWHNSKEHNYYFQSSKIWIKTLKSFSYILIYTCVVTAFTPLRTDQWHDYTGRFLATHMTQNMPTDTLLPRHTCSFWKVVLMFLSGTQYETDKSQIYLTLIPVAPLNVGFLLDSSWKFHQFSNLGIHQFSNLGIHQFSNLGSTQLPQVWMPRTPAAMICTGSALQY